MSESYFAKQPFPDWVLDRATGEHGVSLYVGDVTWISSVLGEVKGGSHCGGLCADGGVYRVAKEKGRWVVVHYELQFMS